MERVTLASIRSMGLRALAALSGVLGLAVLGGAFLAQPSVDWAAAALALLFMIEPCRIVLAGQIDGRARIAMATTASAMPALLLYAFRGHAWQSDMHMIFFATLAVAAMLADWRAILAGTLVVAVHHLLFGLAAPAWVFQDGGSLARILLHAVILVTEACALMWLSNALVELLDGIAAARAASDARQAEAATERAERTAMLDAVITRLSGGLAALRDGDLTTAISGEFPEEFASVRTDFEAARATLAELIGGVQATIAAIGGSSREIAQACEDLARRTEGDAANLEQTAASIAQMDARLRAAAEASASTVGRADGAATAVASGRGIADEAVAAMGRVSESARGIDGVIEGLDKIAFQTRVLAMNAAVEAGRAGDAGRGFAVVADLVSALAMRAEEEAKRARDQLTVTQSDIATAVDAVQRVDGALADITGNVGEVHRLLGGMATDNQAQASAITQISAAVTTMDRSLQQNAAMVEETSAAARTLSGEIEALASQASRFRAGGAAIAASPAKPRAYAAPVKPIARVAAPALAGSEEEWSAF